ncbi:diguanylate cyclase [Erwinia sp. Leaf53]|nr:diguanylate cyclase [Erwinia sp. Leaf53]
MIIKMKISESFRAIFIRDVLLPLVTVLLITLTAACFAVYWASDRTNHDEALQQQKIIQTTLTQNLEEMLKQQRSLTRWQPLEDHLAQPTPDAGWLDDNVGTWLSGMFEHQLIYLLAADGAPRFLWDHGRRVDSAQFSRVNVPVGKLLREMQSASPVSSARRDRVSFALIDNRPAMLAVGEVSGDDSRRGKLIMASVKFIDQGWLNAMAQRNMLTGLRFNQTGEIERDWLGYLLTNVEGSPIGQLEWLADRPGSRMMQVIAPLVAGVVLVITLICVFMIRRLWISSLSLSNSLLQLGASEAQAQHLAFHDVLTGLPNRALVDERLNHAIGRLNRQPGRVALLLLDLDRFKIINDTYGHHAGDELIVEVAHRLSALIRESDTVGRLGGDEFVILQNDVQTPQDAIALATRVLEALNQPFVLLGIETWIGVSIGIALAPDDATERMEMMRKADIALYEAKSQGRGQYRFFERVMDESVKTRQQVGADLRVALQNKRDLAVHYQPLMDIHGQQVLGLEALMRWHHPVHGAISPTEFIPIAEEMGLISSLGEWVLEEACRVARRWPNLTIAVNVSPLQFRASGFVERYTTIVQSAQVSPAHIELEITEGVLMEDEKAAQSIISQLRQVGFRIALDDFGTGYSSLNYLSSFPVDKIKIDRSFTQSLGITENSSAIVESVVKLGHAMGLTVTAEGVENNAQMSALADAGCNQLQGYLFSQAVPESEIAALIEQRKAD